MATIVISEPMHEGAVALLRARHEVHYDPRLVDDAERLHSLVGSCHALVIGPRTEVRGSLLQTMKSCRALGLLRVHDDRVDLDACATLGIQVISEPGAFAMCVAEFVVAASIMLLHRQAATAGHLDAADARRGSREAAGKQIGIVGMGPVGRSVAYLADRMQMKVRAFDPAMDPLFPAFPVSGVEFASLEKLLATSDVVTLHLPMKERMRHRFDAARIGQMQQGAILIDTSCNRTLDLGALEAALRSGRLGGAAIDSLAGPRQAMFGLGQCANTMVFPAVGETIEASERAAQQVARRLHELLR